MVPTTSAYGCIHLMTNGASETDNKQINERIKRKPTNKEQQKCDLRQSFVLVQP